VPKHCFEKESNMSFSFKIFLKNTDIFNHILPWILNKNLFAYRIIKFAYKDSTQDWLTTYTLLINLTVMTALVIFTISVFTLECRYVIFHLYSPVIN
jgi:hypothetical protein